MPDAAALMTPRKRPRQARAQATWDALVEAAAQLLAAHGLARLTTNAVAERAGVSIGSLYQYFPNRDALMVALIERQQAQQAKRLAATLAQLPAADLRSSVTMLVRAAMAHHSANPVLATAIDHEEARLPVGALLDAALVDAGAALAPLFAAHRGEVGSVDPVVAAATLPSLVRAVVDHWANRSPPELARAESEAVRAVIGYLTTSG
jgi:AcrR family transcriptional regulator